LNLLIRLTYANNGNEILGKNGIFLWLSEVMILFNSRETFLVNCFTFLLRLLKSSKSDTSVNNILRVFQKRYLENFLQVLTCGKITSASGGGSPLEKNPDLIMKYSQFLQLGLEAGTGPRTGVGTGAIATQTANVPKSILKSTSMSCQQLLFETGHSEEVLKLFLKYYLSVNEINEQLMKVIQLLCTTTSTVTDDPSSNISYFLSEEKILKYFQIMATCATEESKRGGQEKGGPGQRYQILTNCLPLRLLSAPSTSAETSSGGVHTSSLCLQKYLECLPKTIPYLEQILEQLLSQGAEAEPGWEQTLRTTLTFLQNLFKLSSEVKGCYRDQSRILSLLQQFQSQSSMSPLLEETISQLTH
jgi:hypothetical protein